MIAACRSIWAVLRETLREIGDERAYERHLVSHGLKHSPAEWRRFSDERMARKYQRAKCC